MAFQKDGLEQVLCMNKNEHGCFLIHTKIREKKKKKKHHQTKGGEKKVKKKKAIPHEYDL